MNVISDLTGAAPAPTDAPASPEIPSLAPAGNAPNIPDGPLKVLRGISAGQIPGAVIPVDSPKVSTDLKPEDLAALGVDFYRPHSKEFVGVIFNPQQVTNTMLKKWDKDGSLGDSLPNITSLLGGDVNADSGPAPAADGESAPPVSATVPILPKNTFSASAQGALANDRLKSLDTEPSKRPLPGAGSVLNGLVARAH